MINRKNESVENETVKIVKSQFSKQINEGWGCPIFLNTSILQIL